MSGMMSLLAVLIILAFIGPGAPEIDVRGEM